MRPVIAWGVSWILSILFGKLEPLGYDPFVTAPNPRP